MMPINCMLFSCLVRYLGLSYEYKATARKMNSRQAHGLGLDWYMVIHSQLEWRVLLMTVMLSSMLSIHSMARRPPSVL